MSKEMMRNEGAQICLTSLVDYFHRKCGVELGWRNYKKNPIFVAIMLFVSMVGYIVGDFWED